MLQPMNLRKRNGIYRVWFERSAKYPNGKEISLKTKDEQEAKEVFRALKKQWHESRVIELQHGKQIKLSALKDEYIKARPDLSPDTLRMDNLAIRMLIDSIGDISVKTITDKHFEKFKKVYSAKGTSRHTVNAYLRHIKAALNYAMEQDYIQKMPKIKMVKTGKHLPRILTMDERTRLVTMAEKENFEMYRIIVFALYTGCRRSEIRNLKWQDVDNEICRITGKGDKERILYLLPEALKAMGEMKDIGPVFMQCHIDNYSKSFKAVAIACGINDVHFHNLRHSAATQMIESGIQLPVIQKILGHSDIRTTQIYAQIFDKVVKSEMMKLKY